MILLTCCFALAGPGPASAAAPESIPAPKLDYADIQDVVFLGETPVLIRMHVLVDGKPYQDTWEDFLGSLFRFFDRDGNGSLNRDEVVRAPRPESLVQMRQANFFVPNQRNASLFEMDFDKDGSVSRQEFLEYYRSIRGIQLGPIQPIGQPVFTQGQGSNALSETLFQHLDSNNDGKLSKEEIVNAAKLRKLDLDDDEVISMQELTGNNPFANVFVARQPVPQTPSAFVVLDVPGNPALRIQALLNQYDKNKNQKLSRQEIGFDQAVFDRLDANRDGELEGNEIVGFFHKRPDVELTIRLGKTDGKPAVAGPAPNDRFKIKDLNNGAKQLTLGNAHIDLSSQDGAQAINTLRQTYLAQFKAADKDKKGVLELKDLNTRETQFLRPLFALADRNGDGKLTEAELNAFADLQNQAMQSFASLTLADSGQGLFDVLDANRDGRLSERELRTAWSRLSAWDRDKKDYLVSADIPKQYQMTVGRGQVFNGRVVPAANVVMARPGNFGVPTNIRGPLWFRKMDRNADGDVSPREFLGTAEDFKRLDLDGDGLISADEAEKAVVSKP